MDHARWILSVRTERLSRAGRAFEARGKLLEVRLSALVQEKRDVDDSVVSIHLALEFSLVHALPLHSAAVRRVAELSRRSLALEAQMAVLRRERIGAGMRSKLAGQLADTLIRLEAREESEREALEVAAAARASSLPQAIDD